MLLGKFWPLIRGVPGQVNSRFALWFSHFANSHLLMHDHKGLSSTFRTLWRLYVMQYASFEFVPAPGRNSEYAAYSPGDL